MKLEVFAGLFVEEFVEVGGVVGCLRVLSLGRDDVGHSKELLLVFANGVKNVC